MSIRYIERLTGAGIEPSVGSRSYSCDNALVETITESYKRELTRKRTPWRNREAAELTALQ